MVNKKVGVGFGLVYVLVGVVGFFVTGFNGFASMNGPWGSSCLIHCTTSCTCSSAPCWSPEVWPLSR